MASNFCEDEDEFMKPVFKNGVYDNPFSTWKWFSQWDLMKLSKHFMLEDNSGVNGKKSAEMERNLPICKPDFSKLRDDGVQVMWIGHASVLVRLDGLTLLTDPVFSTRCSPVQYVGTKRYRDPPCTVDDLPEIDAVVISHNHYDHLDYDSVCALNKRFGSKINWFVPKGQGEWMKQSGCNKVKELSWWDEGRLNKNDTPFVFACTPAQHWCRRGVLDKNKALWCGWVVKGPVNSLFFAGDTGYCSAFKPIGKKYGPITLGLIPIGAYCPRWFMKPHHVDPEEAVQIHEDVGAKTSIGIHWGTFKMTVEPYMEPKEKLEEAVRKRGMGPDTFITLKHGEVKQL